MRQSKLPNLLINKKNEKKNLFCNLNPQPLSLAVDRSSRQPLRPPDVGPPGSLCSS
jgi:hypothetical protein